MTTFRPTRTGLLFVVVAVVFYGAALTSQSSLLLLLTGIALGCLIVNTYVAWSGLRWLEIRAPHSVHLCEGERLSQAWQIINRGKRACRFILAESPAGILFRINILAGEAQANVAVRRALPVTI
jgi:hypothetical protein